jgi:predicted DNA-binding protein
MQKSETIVLRVSEVLKDRLTELAESQNRTLSKYTRLQLEMHVYNIDNPIKERRVRRSKNMKELPSYG